MLRRSPVLCWSLRNFFKITKPPASGYEVVELPSETILKDFLNHYKTKGVLVVFHNSEMKVAKEVAKHSKPSTTTSSTSSSTSSSSGSPPASSSLIESDPLLRTFISSMNTMNLGNPDEVKIALVPGRRAPGFLRQYSIITYPTTLLFINGKCVYRCIGARTRELSIKSLFMLRNNKRNIFSR